MTDKGSMHAPRLALAEILGVEPDDVPRVFRGRRPSVLKFGIKEDLFARYPEANKFKIGRWLGRFCSCRPYLSRVVNAKHRHDLDGSIFAPRTHRGV